MTSEAILAVFEAFPAITAEIGSGADMKLYPREGVPQDFSDYPAVVYRMMPNRPTNNNSGPSKFDFRSVDFWCYSPVKSEAEDLAMLLRDELEDQSGTFAGVEVNHILYMDDTDEFSGSSRQSRGSELYVHRIEFNFNYRR